MLKYKETILKIIIINSTLSRLSTDKKKWSVVQTSWNGMKRGETVTKILNSSESNIVTSLKMY